MNIYQIKDWNDHYENNRSRTVKDLAWVPIPNRHDGESYSRLMIQKDAAIYFSTWILLLQVASRCHPRGSLLTSTGIPHTPESLSIKTRGKLEWFEKSLPFLVQIGWLSVSCQEGDGVLTASCQSGDEEGRKEGMESTEGLEHKHLNVKDNSTFKEPTALEVEEYAKTIDFKVDGEYFIAHYRKTGWKIKSSPIKDWRACVVTWKKGSNNKNGYSKSSSRPLSREEIEAQYGK